MNNSDATFILESIRNGGDEIMILCDDSTPNIYLFSKLLSLKPDLFIVNEHGDTAFLRAANNNKIEYMKLLIEHNVDINQTSRYGYTALICASRRRHVDVVELLLRNGVDYKTFAVGFFCATFFVPRSHAL